MNAPITPARHREFPLAAAAYQATNTTLTLLDTEPALQALQPEWQALWARLPNTTPFASPAWLLPWWHQFGTPNPRVATARRNGRLVGILPLYQLDEPGSRKLLPIGAGITDFLDALLEEKTDAAPLLDLALARARTDKIDACDLIDIPPGSALHAVAPEGWHAHWSDGATCPVLTLPATNLVGAIPAQTLRKLRMNRNRAERAGGYTVEVATPGTAAPMLETLIRLHQARWTAQGHPGVLADPAVLTQLHEAAPALLATGALRLATLHHAGTHAAACLTLLAGPDRILFYLSGFDAAQAAISPGTLLLAHLLEQAIAEGRTEANFLRGNEPYKYAWGAKDRPNRTLHLTPA